MTEEYQIGVHDIDTTGSIADEENVIEFDFESEAVFKRLADDIYESAEAGVREPLTNAITAVRRAFDGDTDDGVIKITVEKGEQPKLYIRDNGTGITWDALENILTVIGRSSVRDDGTLTGQYGMGFLASYKLVGSDGGFFMTTNPRDSNEGPYNGMFRPGAFEPDTDNQMPTMLDDDEYGTVFRYLVKESVNVKEIRKWVEKHSEWSPVPVIYEEYNQSGTVVYNEDFHTSELSDRYGSEPFVSYEDEYFEIASSPAAEGDTVLLTSPTPVDDSKTRIRNKHMPWNVDIRLKYENGIVVDGKHEGLAPVNSSEYESMDDGRKQNYVPEDRLRGDDIRLPTPIGTREKLNMSEEFIKYANMRLRSEFQNKVEKAVDNFNPDTDNLQSVPREISDTLKVLANMWGEETVSGTGCSTQSISLSDSEATKLAKKLTDFHSTEDFDEDDDIVQYITSIGEKATWLRDDAENETGRIHDMVGFQGDTYACVTYGSWKFEAVESSDTISRVVKIPRADMYEFVEEKFGWTPLKRLDVDSAQTELDLTEDEVSEIRGGIGSQTETKEKTVNVYSSKSESSKYKAEEIRENATQVLKNGRSDARFILLFPRGFDKNLSDNKWMTGGGVKVASCPKDVMEYITKNDSVMTYEDYIDKILRKTVETSEGEMSLGQFLSSSRDKIIYRVSSRRKQEFPQDAGILDTFCLGIIQENGNVDSDAMMLALADSDGRMQGLTNVIRLDADTVEDNMFVAGSLRGMRGYSFGRVDVDGMKTYMKGLSLGELRNTQIYSDLKNDRLSAGSIRLVESIKKSYNIDKKFDTLEMDKTKLPIHDTRDGRMNIREIYNEYRSTDVVVYVTDSSSVGYFQTDTFLEEASTGLAGRTFSNRRGSFESDVSSTRIFPTNRDSEVILVPMSESEYSRVENHLKSRTTVLTSFSRLGSSKYGRNNSTTQVDEGTMYAAVRLENWDADTINSAVAGRNFSKAKRIVDSLKPLHDEGRSPSL